MLSDVLSESIHRIRYYQKEMPHIYDLYGGQIEELVSKMGLLLRELDTPPRRFRFERQVRLAGVTYRDAQDNIKRFGSREYGPYPLIREPDNPHDRSAIRVEFEGQFLGYIPREDAAEFAPLMDSGRCFVAYFVSRNQHPFHDTVGLTVRIEEVPCREVA